MAAVIALSVTIAACSSAKRITTLPATTTRTVTPTTHAAPRLMDWRIDARAAMIPLWSRLVVYRFAANGYSFESPAVPSGLQVPVMSDFDSFTHKSRPVTAASNASQSVLRNRLADAVGVVAERLDGIETPRADAKFVRNATDKLNQFASQFRAEARCRAASLSDCATEQDSIWISYVALYRPLMNLAARVDTLQQKPLLTASWPGLPLEMPIKLSPTNVDTFAAPLPPITSHFSVPPCTKNALDTAYIGVEPDVDSSTRSTIVGWRCAGEWAIIDRSDLIASRYELLRARQGRWWSDYPMQPYAGAFRPYGVPLSAMQSLEAAPPGCEAAHCFVDVFPVNWSLPGKCPESKFAPFWFTTCGWQTEPSRPTVTTTPTTSHPTASRIRSVDFKNFTVQVHCGEDLRTIRLVKGAWTDPHGATSGSVSGIEVKYFDATGDGTEDAIVTIVCGIGVSNFSSDVLVYSIENGVATRVGLLGGYKPTAGATAGTIVITSPEYSPNDPRCCASHSRLTTYKYDGRIFVEQSNIVVPAPR